MRWGTSFTLSVGCGIFLGGLAALANDSALNEGAFGPEPLDVLKGTRARSVWSTSTCASNSGPSGPTWW